MAKSKVPKNRFTLHVRADLKVQDHDRQLPKMFAYVFSGGGRLLNVKPLGKDNKTSLTVPGTKERGKVQVFLGPEIDKDKISVAELKRRGGLREKVIVGPQLDYPEIVFPVINEKILCWLRSLCFVQGNLLKRVDRDGISIDMPVCHAKVEIYEVDPLYLIIPRIPDIVIERIREDIIDPIGPVVNREFPELPVEITPPPVPATPLPDNLTPLSGNAPNYDIDDPEIRQLAKTTNTLQFRNVLIKHADKLKHILSLHWPVTKKLVATTTTDDCGKFKAFFFNGCKNPDTPDLYFIARQKIFFPINITIYEPKPVSCHTYWNYQCGTEVTLYTNHPLARTCAPCLDVEAPNNWVMVSAVGNLSLNNIRGTSEDLEATTNATNKGLTSGGSAFGGLLRFRLEFDHELRDSLGVKYYKMYYRKGNSGDFTPMTGTVNRHYTKEVDDELILKAYNLGPKTAGTTTHLFEIPPALPPEGQWSIPNAVEDTTSAWFNSLDIAALQPKGVAWPEHGKYQIKVELYTDAGNLVDIDAKAIKYVVQAEIDADNTIHTTPATDLGLVHVLAGETKKSFVMELHIDNSRCLAQVGNPSLKGTGAGLSCGVIEYKGSDMADPVDMPFEARHPNGFATYSFSVKRGVSTQLVDTGNVPNPPATSVAQQSVNNLLDGCEVAGFSEALHVWAKVTNGWSRQSAYDDFDHRAFVLSNK
jgi:hypothetical protein